MKNEDAIAAFIAAGGKVKTLPARDARGSDRDLARRAEARARRDRKIEAMYRGEISPGDLGIED